jgi:hypothetical protein
LDDDLLEPNLIDSIKENVEFYIEVRNITLIANISLLLPHHGRLLPQSAADDDGATGVEEEINIYEELHQEAESVAAGQGSTQVPEPDVVSDEEPEPAKPVAAAGAAAESKGDDGMTALIPCCAVMSVLIPFPSISMYSFQESGGDQKVRCGRYDSCYCSDWREGRDGHCNRRTTSRFCGKP